MFGDLADRWVALLPSAEVGKQPQRVLVGDVPLVVWRAAFGRPVVFWDRCPHREHPLSSGRRTLTGRLICDAHQWTFAADGRCVYTDRPRDLSRCGATVFPCREVDGTLWVFTGPEAVGKPG